MDEGARLLEEALELARAVGDRHAIARAAAALSWVLDQQVQFMPAARIADEALQEIGEGDDLETALLLVRRASAIMNGSRRGRRAARRCRRARSRSRARTATAASSSRRWSSALASTPATRTRGIELEELAIATRAWDRSCCRRSTRARSSRARSRATSRADRAARRRARRGARPARDASRGSTRLERRDRPRRPATGTTQSHRRGGALDIGDRERLRPRRRPDVVGGAADRRRAT